MCSPQHVAHLLAESSPDEAPQTEGSVADQTSEYGCLKHKDAADIPSCSCPLAHLSVASWQPFLSSAVARRRIELGHRRPDTFSCDVLIGGPGQRFARTLGTRAWSG